MKKALLLFIPCVVAVGGCATQMGDVAPTHTVRVAVRANNISASCPATMLVQKNTGQVATTVYSRNLIQGYETFYHEEKPVKTGTTFTAEVGFYSPTGQPVVVPNGTMLRASILVDGVEKNTVTISAATPANTAGQRAATISITL